MTNTIPGALALGTLVLIGCSSGGGGGGKSPLSGTQAGSVTVDLQTAALELVQPNQIKLSGAAAVDDPTDTVTLSLTVQNNSSTVLQSPKVLFNNLSEGTLSGDGSFGPAPIDGGGLSFVGFGPEAIPPGGQVARDIEITGVTSTTGDLTLDLELITHPLLFLPANQIAVVAVDSSGSGMELNALDQAAIWDLGFETRSGMRCDATSPDGRYAYYTNRNQPAILTFDTVELTLTMGPSLIGGTIAFDGTGVVGCIDGLRSSPDGEYLYATVNHGTHVSTQDSSNWTTPTEVEVVKLSAKNLKVLDRVTVWTPTPLGGGQDPGDGGGDPPYFPDILGRRISITPDGLYGALSITGVSEVLMLDLETLSVMDSWTVGGFVPRHTAISADATQIAVCYNRRDDSDGTLELIDVGTGVISPLAPPTLDAGALTYSSFLEWGPDGRLYYGRSFNASVPGVSIFDPTGPSWTEIDDLFGSAIEFREENYWVWDSDLGELHFYDYTDVEQAFPGSGTAGLTAAGSWGHGMTFAEGVAAEE